mgnify:CR=1 FL=1
MYYFLVSLIKINKKYILYVNKNDFYVIYDFKFDKLIGKVIPLVSILEVFFCEKASNIFY